VPDGDVPGAAPQAPAPLAGASATAAAAPSWVWHSTAAPVSPAPPSPATSTPPPAAPAPVAALVAAKKEPEAPVAPPASLVSPTRIDFGEELPPAPTIGSADGRLTLTNTSLTVLGRTFGLREIERAEVQPVRWLFWYLLGALGLAIVLILFLSNALRTLPAMAGLLATALLLLYGHRGTNRLRLWLLGREAVHFALPGDADTWRRLVAETNRRVARAHDQAAAEAARLLAALEAERNAAAAATMQAQADQYPPNPAIPGAPA